MDTTYTPFQRSFLYLVAIMDWAPRPAPLCRLPNTPEARFCIDTCAEALLPYGRPRLFNTDPASQYASRPWSKTWPSPTPWAVAFAAWKTSLPSPYGPRVRPSTCTTPLTVPPPKAPLPVGSTTLIRGGIIPPSLAPPRPRSTKTAYRRGHPRSFPGGRPFAGSTGIRRRVKQDLSGALDLSKKVGPTHPEVPSSKQMSKVVSNSGVPK